VDSFALGNSIRGVIVAVVSLQLIAAVLTFTPVPNRRVGLGSLSLIGYLIVLVGSRSAQLLLPAVVPGIAAVAGSLALFIWARITIHGKFFSYINSTDVPQFVCSGGPYRWIRHPFYTSYLLSLLAVTVMFPNPITAAGLVVAFVGFNAAAAFEESKFEGSPVAAEYAAYLQRTGRFFPRM